MQWHIVTSSKGGVGKTLLTLLLAARNIELGTTTLVIDLNAMNADSGNLLVKGAPKSQPPITLLHPKAAKETEQLGAENIFVQRVYSLYRNQQRETTTIEQIPYAVGWPSNPFNLYRPSLFADFLCIIKQSLPEIQNKLGLKIESVIIDTNYHFCNIFSQHEEYYNRYQEELADENITCWFLWVYRQLDNLITGNVGANKVYTSAELMEKHLRRDKNSTPIMHVISPVSLVSSQVLHHPQDNNDTSAFLKILNTIFKAGAQEVLVADLDKVAEAQKGNYQKFSDWVDNLESNRRMLKVFGDPREQEGAIFLRTLLKTLEKERPMNVIPLWNYHPKLQRYTDKESDDQLAFVMSLKIYDSFKKLLA